MKIFILTVVLLIMVASCSQITSKNQVYFGICEISYSESGNTDIKLEIINPTPQTYNATVKILNNRTDIEPLKLSDITILQNQNIITDSLPSKIDYLTVQLFIDGQKTNEVFLRNNTI